MAYLFHNPELLETALTTPSFRMDHPDATDNQRLEFLGDSLIGMLAAERLYAEFPTAHEGALTVMKAKMVSTAALCDAAERTHLVEHLKRNRAAQPLPPDSKTYADAMEALIGAAYLDGGYAAAKVLFDSFGLTADAHGAEWSENPKGDLQILSQAMDPPRRPVYECLAVAGKAHEPIFTVRVTVEGLGSAVASASSRRHAEGLAAQELLKRGHERAIA